MDNQLPDQVSESRIKNIPVIGLFWEKSFLQYTWVSIGISLLNIFLLWLLIDILKISTVISSTLVIGGTFIIRYLIFRFLKIV